MDNVAIISGIVVLFCIIMVMTIKFLIDEEREETIRTTDVSDVSDSSQDNE